MTYIEGVGYVDERSYNAYQKTQQHTIKQSFDNILEKETTIYAKPENTTASQSYASQTVVAPEEMEQYFQDASTTYGVDVNLLKAIAKQESDFNPNATSSAGAIGIMQLMPDNVRELGINNPYNAKENIMGGAQYISNMLSRYNGDLQLALAAYNAGPGNVEKYGGVPPFAETTNYIQKVTGYMGQTLTIDTAGYTDANTIYSVASTDATQAPKIYTIYAKPEQL